MKKIQNILMLLAVMFTAGVQVMAQERQPDITLYPEDFKAVFGDSYNAKSPWNYGKDGNAFLIKDGVTFLIRTSAEISCTDTNVIFDGASDWSFAFMIEGSDKQFDEIKVYATTPFSGALGWEKIQSSGGVISHKVFNDPHGCQYTWCTMYCKGCTKIEFFLSDLPKMSVTGIKNPYMKSEYISTFYCDSTAYDVPDGVTAYIVKENTEENIYDMEPIAGSVIAQSEAVVLKSAVQTFELTQNRSYKGKPNAGNVLVGRCVEETRENRPLLSKYKTYFAISINDKRKIGFFEARTGSDIIGHWALAPKSLPLNVHSHTLVKTDAVNPTDEYSGHKTYWHCEDGNGVSVCGLYFNDAEGESEIGDSEAFDVWISEGGDGYLPVQYVADDAYLAISYIDADDEDKVKVQYVNTKRIDRIVNVGRYSVGNIFLSNDLTVKYKVELGRSDLKFNYVKIKDVIIVSGADITGVPSSTEAADSGANAFQIEFAAQEDELTPMMILVNQSPVIEFNADGTEVSISRRKKTMKESFNVFDFQKLTYTTWQHVHQTEGNIIANREKHQLVCHYPYCTIDDNFVLNSAHSIGDNGFCSVCNYDSRGYNLDIKEGWNWYSYSVGASSTQVMDDAKKDATFIGSQRLSITRMDDQWYGDLTLLEAGTGYKIFKTANNASRYFGTSPLLAVNSVAPRLDLGWNWIGYMPAWKQKVSEALAAFTPADGDIIKGQTNSAVYGIPEGKNVAEWIGDFMMEPGKMYLYYNNGVVQKSLEYTEQMYDTGVNPYSSDAKPMLTETAPEKHFRWNAHQWRDNMSVVAKVQGDDGQYEVGAFAGDVCRGASVSQSGYHIITVSGQTIGEEISFVVYDTETGESYIANETIMFNGTSEGSISNPLVLTLSQTTGVDVHSITPANNDKMYNVYGVQVNASYKGIVVQKGKKNYKLNRYFE